MEEVLSGHRPPGARLDESKLAQHFGVSRTPVREALRELAAADLVVLRPRQGAVVATVTVTQLLHMFEVMAELASFCARLAARRMTADERRRLAERSEEHTSELQSLMRISSAVLCLTTKTNT